MSNDYPPPPGPGQYPEGQSGQPPPPPPSGPQWNPQSAGTPPESSGGTPSYGQPGYGQEPYGQQPYGQPPGYPPQPPGAPGGYGAPKKSPLAIVALVTGIIGAIPCCWSVPVFGIAALVTGFIGRKQIDESQGQLNGRGMATAGVVLGVIVIVIAVVYWILYAAGVFDSVLQYNFETTTD